MSGTTDSSTRNSSARVQAFSSITRPRKVAGSSPKQGRQPIGVVTMPTQCVSPSGSLVTGRSCGTDEESGVGHE